MQFDATNSESLRSEYQSLITDNVDHLIATVKGSQHWIQMQKSAGIGSPAAEIGWILQAHLGTLEKLSTLLPTEREPTTFELIAVARNLFENLVWCRLLDKDNKNGFYFYGGFLADHLQDVTGLIKKIHDEIELFETAERRDTEITNDMVVRVSKAMDDAEKTQRIVNEAETLRKALDQEIRRSFTIHAASAKYYGYGYQIHLMKTKELPRMEEQLEKIKSHITDFEKLVGDDSIAKKYMGNPNWSQRAKLVGMVDQYDYLYRLSSRLLHSGPMNILTEKELTKGEVLVLLEFTIVATQDILELIEKFTFPGQVKLLAIEAE